MPSHCRPGLAFVLLLAGALGVSVVGAQSSGRFPGTGDNAAMVIQYSMTGVEVTGAPRDNGPSMQWHRKISGKMTGRRIGLNATVSLTQPGYPKCNTAGGGFYFTVEARVSAGSKRATFVHPASGACRDAQFPTTVNLAVDVPDDATSAGISVRATYVNPMYGDRVSLVNGEFTATPRVRAGGGGGARPTPPPAVPTPFGGDDGTDGTDDDLPPWVKVVGTAAALAAGVAMISRILSSRRARKPTRPPQYGYILQLSAEEIQVEEGKPATVSTRVWRVDEQGAISPVPDATLAVASPDPALQVSPDSGKGTIECTVVLVRQPGSPTIVLTVTGQAGGQTVQASVRVVLQPLRLGAWVAGLKEADAFFDARARAWGFREIVAFFHDTDEKPCTPPAGCTFQVAAVPDVLEAGPARSDDGLTWTLAVRLRPGTDLDAHLGPLLQRHEGRVKATVTATAADGRVLASTVAYRLRPTLTVFLRAFDGDPQREDGHEYVGAVLPPGELVADGRDAVHLVAFVCRTDLADDPRRAFERRFPAPLDLTVELTGRDADAFQVCPPTRLTDPALLPRLVPEGCTAFAVSARRPILHDGRTREVGARLRAKLLDSRHSSGYEIAEDTVEITLSVDPVHLALWVLPGQYRGTSEAWAFARVVLPREPWAVPLPGLTLELGVEQPGNGACLQIHASGPDIRLSRTPGAVTADLVASQPQALSPHQRQSGVIRRNTPLGVAGWLLHYSGLTWANAPSSCFIVKCRCAGLDEAVSFTVDVGENGRQLASALEAAVHGLDMTNPEFDSYWSSPSLVSLLTVAEARGPLYNMRTCAYDIAVWAGLMTPAPEGDRAYWIRYNCGQYSARIVTWLMERRHLGAAATALRMNGIEFCQYVCPGIHDWAGIHLSGAGVNDDPAFIDPWWWQEWNSHATGAGWYTMAARGVLVHALLLAELLVVIGALYTYFAGIGCKMLVGLKEFVAKLYVILRDVLLHGRRPPLPAWQDVDKVGVLVWGGGSTLFTAYNWLMPGANRGSPEYSDGFTRYIQYGAHIVDQLVEPLASPASAVGAVQGLRPWGP